MFTLRTAAAKVKKAQALWNTRNPAQVVQAYTPDTCWRNRDCFLSGHAAVESFLEAKWQKEQDYILRKELFAFVNNRIAVQFWYEYRAKEAQRVAEALQHGDKQWRRCYGLEHWIFASDGRMQTRMMSGNEVAIHDAERWFVDVDTVDQVLLPSGHASAMLSQSA